MSMNKVYHPVLLGADDGKSCRATKGGKTHAQRLSSLKWTLKAVSKLKEGANPPTIVDVSPFIESMGERVALGGSCDIYKGKMLGKGWVAIKRPRVMQVTPDILHVREVSIPITHRS